MCCYMLQLYELLGLIRLFCLFWVLLRIQMLVPGYKHRILFTVSVRVPDTKSRLCYHSRLYLTPSLGSVNILAYT
jgi:hypothetical protein